MMRDVIILVIIAIMLIISYTIYYQIGRVLGGLSHGKVITAIVIMLIGIFNGICNAGGVQNLMWMIQNVDGFVIGYVVVAFGTMEYAAWKGTNKPRFLFSKKEKWLI